MESADFHEKLKGWLVTQPSVVSLHLINRCGLRCVPYVSSQETPLITESEVAGLASVALRCSNVAMITDEPDTEIHKQLVISALSKLRRVAIAIEASAWGQKTAEKKLAGDDDKFLYGRDAEEVENALFIKKAISVPGDASDVASMILDAREGEHVDKKLIATVCADGVLYASEVFGDAIWDEVNRDVDFLSNTVSFRKIYETSLTKSSDTSSARTQKFCSLLDGNGLGHWSDWYKDLDGRREIDWDLVKKIALVDGDLWENDVSVANERIGKIWARRKLHRAIADFREQIGAKDRLGIGGNHPPELIFDENDDPEAENVKFLGRIFELERVTQGDQIDEDHVSELVQRIEAGLSKFVAWCGGKVDRVINKLIDWGVPIAMATALANAEKIRDAVGKILISARQLVDFL